jgi:hypothetical protein
MKTKITFLFPGRDVKAAECPAIENKPSTGFCTVLAFHAVVE